MKIINLNFMIINLQYLFMTTEVFNKKINDAKKLHIALKSDFADRQFKQKQGKPLFDLDAEIRGTFKQLEELERQIQIIYNNFRSNPKDFGFTNRQIQKRGQSVNALKNERISLKNQYDSYFAKDKEKTKPDQRYQKYQKMTKQQLVQQKVIQQKDEEQLLDELIDKVKHTKNQNKDIGQELDDQDKDLDKLGQGMDKNMQNMGKVKRNMMKLLDSSNNCCLIFAILVQIASLVCIIIFWQ